MPLRKPAGLIAAYILTLTIVTACASDSKTVDSFCLTYQPVPTLPIEMPQAVVVDANNAAFAEVCLDD